MSRTLPRRLLGGLLLVLGFAPLYRVLNDEDDGLRQSSVAIAEVTLDLLQTGTLTVLLLGGLLAFLVPRERVLPALDRVGAVVMSVSPGRWALAVGLTAFVLATSVTTLLFQGLFTHVDEISAFLQARYLAAGRMAGALPAGPEGWLIPNTFLVEAGWVSHFPPSHLAALAAGAGVGLPMLVGPVFFGVMATASSLALVRLLPDHGRSARLGGALVALSPFALVIGAGGWSHVTAGALLWASLYFALRARDGHVAWSVAAGAAIGFAVCSRPWISLLLGTLATLGVWLPERRTPIWLVRRAAGTVVGGLPFAVGLGLYNRALFGAPTTLGYLAAFGERHQLGFHADPWGNLYTPVDALALTSADVIVFGARLLETPVPLGAAIGLWLLLAGKLPRGAGLLVGWAVVPVAANAVYWFHGPRMLFEAGPAWLGLSVLAVAPLFTARAEPDPDRNPDSGASEAPTSSGSTSGRTTRRVEPASVGVWATGVTLVMALVLGVPQRMSGIALTDETVGRVTVPSPPDGRPALVFVHASWYERLSARLQGAGGMRQDSVISLLRRNTNCELDAYATARSVLVSGGDATLPAIDLRQEPGAPDDIIRPQTIDGTTIRTRQGERFSAACQREMGADRFGVVALAPLLWQGDLPGLERGAPLFVRDLGPEWNESLVRRYADRTPWVFVPRAPGTPPELVPYAEAMQVLWGPEPGSPEADRTP